jgi:hypothetical protein
MVTTMTKMMMMMMTKMMTTFNLISRLVFYPLFLTSWTGSNRVEHLLLLRRRPRWIPSSW